MANRELIHRREKERTERRVSPDGTTEEVSTKEREERNERFTDQPRQGRVGWKRIGSAIGGIMRWIMAIQQAIGL